MGTSQALNNNHIDYRPDIDGLRALAVIAVVIFHAFPFQLRGGFVGVDIFFVISGYLITSIILKGVANNSFSFVDFYARRIRRIFPALSVVLAACLAFGWFALFADEYMQLGKHIAGGAGFISNFVLWSEVGYFDNAAETKPLLHLWSLGIEEQFYFIWPLLLWFAWKKRLNGLHITIGVILLSFIACTVALKSNATAAFYAPWNRFWELCCGAALAHVTIFHQDWLVGIKAKANGYLNRVVYRNSVDGSNDTLNHALSVIGFLLLITSFITIHKGRSFPGKWALMPVIGSVLIIVAGQQAYINRKILSNKVLVWVGLISYPLYLWHWPILSFMRIMADGTPSLLLRGLAVLASIFVSYATYQMIEVPIRYGKRNNKIKIRLLAMMMLLFSVVGLLTYGLEELGPKYNLKDTNNNPKDWGDLSKIYLSNCPEKFKNYHDCFLFSSAKSEDVLLIGDSHAGSLIPGIFANKPETLTFGAMIVNGGCPPVLNVERRNNGLVVQNYGQTGATCSELNNYRIGYAASSSAKTVIIAAILSSYNSNNRRFGDQNNYRHTHMGKPMGAYDAFSKGLEDTVRLLTNKGKNVVLFIDNPIFEDQENPIHEISIRKCLHQGRKDRLITWANSSECKISKRTAELQQNAIFALYKEIERRYSGKVSIFNALDYLCNNDNCPMEISGSLLYRDGNHLSYDGSLLLMRGFFQEVGTLRNEIRIRDEGN